MICLRDGVRGAWALLWHGRTAWGMGAGGRGIFNSLSQRTPGDEGVRGGRPVGGWEGVRRRRTRVCRHDKAATKTQFERPWTADFASLLNIRAQASGATSEAQASARNGRRGAPSTPTPTRILILPHAEPSEPQ